MSVLRGWVLFFIFSEMVYNKLPVHVFISDIITLIEVNLKTDDVIIVDGWDGDILISVFLYEVRDLLID